MAAATVVCSTPPSEVRTPVRGRNNNQDHGGTSEDDDEDETPLGLWLQGAVSNGSVASSGHERFDLAQRTFNALKHEWITAAPGGADPCDQQHQHAHQQDASMARTYGWVEATLSALGYTEDVVAVNAPADDSLGLEQPTADGDVSLVVRPPRRAYHAARESVSATAAAAMLLAASPHRHRCPDSALVQSRTLSTAFTAPVHHQQRDPDRDDDGGGRVSVLALGVSVLFSVALECECLEEAVGMLDPELRYLIDVQRAITRTTTTTTTTTTAVTRSIGAAAHGSPASIVGSPHTNAAAAADGHSSPPLRCLVGDPQSTVAAERQYRRVALTAAMATLVSTAAHANTTSRSSRKTARGHGSSRNAGAHHQHQRSNSGVATNLIGSQAQSPGHTAAPSPRDGTSHLQPSHPQGHAAFPGANDSTSSAAASLGFAGASQFADGGSMVGGVAPTNGSFTNSLTHNGRFFGGDSTATRGTAGAGPAGSSARPHPLASPFGAAGQSGTARQFLGFTPTGDCLSERAAFGAPTLAGAQSSLVADGVAGSWGRSQPVGTDTGTTPGAHSLTNAALLGLGPPARSPVAETWQMRGSDRESLSRAMNPMRQGQVASGSPTTPAPPPELPSGSGHTHPGGDSSTSATGSDNAAHRQEFVRQMGVAVTGLLLSGRAPGPSTMLAKRSALHAAAAAGYRWHAAPTILAAIAREGDEGSIAPDVTKGVWYPPTAPGASIAPALRTRLSLPPEGHFSSVVVVAADVPDQPDDATAGDDPNAAALVDTDGRPPPTGRSLRTLMGRGGQESLRLTPKGPPSSQASHRTRRSTRGSASGSQLDVARGSGGPAAALGNSSEILNHPDDHDDADRRAGAATDPAAAADGNDRSSQRTQPTRREAKYRVKNAADLPPEEQEARKCCAGGCAVA